MKRNRFALFLAGVFLVKLVVVLQLADHPLLQPDAGLDTSVYASLADQVRAGEVGLGPGLYFVSPLYIYFLAAVLAVSHSYVAVRVVQIALGTAAVAGIFVAAREWFGCRAAWLAAAGAALTGVFTFFESLLLQAALDPFLTAAALAFLALALARERGRRGWFFVAGLAFGLQILNRPNVAVAAGVLLALLVLSRRFRPALMLAGGLLAALAPVMARNAVVARDISPVASHGGLNFYIGNNAEADGTYHSVPGITPNITGQEDDARRVAERALGRALDDGEVSAYFYRLGLRWIADHPAAAARLFVRKIGYTLSAAYLALNYSYPFYAYDMQTLLAVLIVGAWLLVPLGIAGLTFAAPRDRRADYLIWASFVPAYALSVAAFFVSDRYRLPLLVPMCVGAGAALDGAMRWWHTRPRRASASAIALTSAAVLVVNWPYRLDDGRTEERTRMAEQLIADGRSSDAEFWARKAESSSAEPALVQLRVGRELLARQAPADAVRHLERASMLDPGSAEIDYALGEALVDAGRPRDAIPHLRRALDAGVRPDLTAFDLARALASTGDRLGARQALARAKPANPRDADSWVTLAELAVRVGAPELARSFFERVAALRPRDAAAQLNLAVALAEEGRVDEARSRAREALRLDPDYERARQFLAALR